MGSETLMTVGLMLGALLTIGAEWSPRIVDQVTDFRLSRYQTVATQPRAEERDPLVAVITIEFDDAVNTVGDAIVAILDGSGYRLAAPNPESCQSRLFRLPLPSAHRKLGPLSLRQALDVLTGPAWRLVVDQASRLLSFEPVPLEEPVERGDCRCD